ncbi:nitroreductase [Streptococcus rupicaprae]|uniref:Nitroreductase n=1 Tax=Streptococcus rupicaprae TaxID=759619 RepID=A0ABV2FFK5_9STRE
MGKLAEQGQFQTIMLEVGHFFIFCSDVKRHADFAQQEGDSSTSLAGCGDGCAIDATLVSQNRVIAVESMGLGSCYIGGIRDRIETIADLLQLPEHVYPVYGLSVGHPAHRNPVKSHFYSSAIYHHNH